MQSQAWHRSGALEGMTVETAHILLAKTRVRHDVMMFRSLPGLSYLSVACSLARTHDVFSECLVADI